MKLIRVVARNFVAGFEIDDGRVVRAAPILSKRFIGLTEDQARDVIAHFGWKASVIPEPGIDHHFQEFGGSNSGSFEVRWPGGRKFFYYDDNAGRRAVSGHVSSEKALIAAQRFLHKVTKYCSVTSETSRV